MRGFFGVGVEGISKSMNLGNLMRTAHAFGASFFVALNADIKLGIARHADTAASTRAMPFYAFDGFDDLVLPKGCGIVGVEFAEDAVMLPSFRHPPQALYVLGSERGELSPKLQNACTYMVKIPTAFCLNVATAGAIVLYDRLISHGRFAERPLASGGPRSEPPPRHVWGKPIARKVRNA